MIFYVRGISKNKNVWSRVVAPETRSNYTVKASLRKNRLIQNKLLPCMHLLPRKIRPTDTISDAISDLFETESF